AVIDISEQELSISCSLHRLHHARQAPMHAKAGETVTSICMRFGVRDIGRFAMQYRRLFGVLPSQTLRASHLGMQAPH
ncbi:helix-turn-helix domain-containing protein, partial [Cupriavidus necator]